LSICLFHTPLVLLRSSWHRDSCVYAKHKKLHLHYRCLSFNFLFLTSCLLEGNGDSFGKHGRRDRNILDTESLDSESERLVFRLNLGCLLLYCIWRSWWLLSFLQYKSDSDLEIKRSTFEYLHLLWFVSCFHSSFYVVWFVLQTSKRVSLYISHDHWTNKPWSSSHVSRFKFILGILVHKENIWEKKICRFHFSTMHHFWCLFIYQNLKSLWCKSTTIQSKRAEITPLPKESFNCCELSGNVYRFWKYLVIQMLHKNRGVGVKTNDVFPFASKVAMENDKLSSSQEPL
jgi:hypothetical protein